MRHRPILERLNRNLERAARQAVIMGTRLPHARTFAVYDALQILEREIIAEALRVYPTQALAAEALGMCRNTLSSKMELFGMRTPRKPTRANVRALPERRTDTQVTQTTTQKSGGL